MFSQFIYFIVALMTLTLYQPTKAPALTPFDACLWFAGLIIFFALWTRSRFQRLTRQVGLKNRDNLDQTFSVLVTRYSIVALALFAADIWILDLPSYFLSLHIFSLLPTLEDLLFLSIFLGYLMIVWTYAFDAHRAIYNSDISRTEYVYANLAFSVPILLPWLLLFGISDIILLLPFDLPKQFLNSSIGQISYFIVFLLIAAIFAPVVVQRFWRCSPVEQGSLRQRIAALCQRAGVRYSDIMYWPIFGGRMITAGVMGLVGRFRYILVTKALLRLLNPEELDQVIAHEIGHVKRRHLLLYLIFFAGFMLISLGVYPLSYFLVFFFQPMLRLLLFFKWDANTFFNLIYSILLVIGIVTYFRFVFGYFIRNFERQADLFVFRLFPSVQPLITTFGKIALSSGQAADKPNWHHFSIQQRIDYLRLCEGSPIWIDYHDRKVRRSIGVYLIAFAVLSFLVFQFNQMVFSTDGRIVRLSVIEDYLAAKTEKTPEDAYLYWMVGNIYYGRDNQRPAIAAYEKALALNPSDPAILNNLAMLLATATENGLRDPARALALAQKAYALQKEPYILDTLAQALYANGRVKEAVQAEKQALSMNPPDRETYEAQLQKFEKALEGKPQ